MLTKLLPIAIICLFLFEGVSAQSIYFSFKDGTSAAYNVNEVRNVSFSGNVMILRKKDGTTVSWNASSIGNYHYDAVTPVNNIPLFNNAEVKIYPNPFKGSVHIRYVLPTTEHVAIEIFDMQGRNIRNWPMEKKNAGTYEFIWQVNDTNGNTPPKGTYILRITTSKGSISKMMMLE